MRAKSKKINWKYCKLFLYIYTLLSRAFAKKKPLLFAYFGKKNYFCSNEQTTGFFLHNNGYNP